MNLKTNNNKRKILIVLFFLITTIESPGQELKYNNVKNQFTTENYREVINHQKYSPFVAGLCNFAYPLSGYLYIREPVRGLLVTGSQLVTTGVFLYGFMKAMEVNYDYEKAPAAKTIMLSGIISSSVLYIWSVFDVVKIAKIKNLAWQKRQQVNIEFAPDISLSQYQNKSPFSAGISLKITF